VVVHLGLDGVQLVALPDLAGCHLVEQVPHGPAPVGLEFRLDLLALAVVHQGHHHGTHRGDERRRNKFHHCTVLSVR
jgi:hypothetical protein